MTNNTIGNIICAIVLCSNMNIVDNWPASIIAMGNTISVLITTGGTVNYNIGILAEELSPVNQPKAAHA